MTCVVAVIERFSDYDPRTGADFTTYLYPFITDALLYCRMLEESWFVDSLDQYKKIRGIAWKYRTSGENAKKTISEYAAEKNCKQETAAEYLNAAKGIRSRQSFYVSRQDEDSEETGEDVSRDDYWDYAEILWNGIKAEAIQKAFDALDYREQTLLEKRNAICMRCGRVSPMSSRSSFEELATLFEGSGTCISQGAGQTHHYFGRRGYSARYASKMQKHYQKEKRNRHRNLSVSGRLRWRMGRNIF